MTKVQSQPMMDELSTEVDLVLWVQLDPKEAADHIEQLRKRITELESKLQPFAALAEIYESFSDGSSVYPRVTVADLRAAARDGEHK